MFSALTSCDELPSPLRTLHAQKRQRTLAALQRCDVRCFPALLGFQGWQTGAVMLVTGHADSSQIPPGLRSVLGVGQPTAVAQHSAWILPDLQTDAVPLASALDGSSRIRRVAASRQAPLRLPSGGSLWGLGTSWRIQRLWNGGSVHCRCAASPPRVDSLGEPLPCALAPLSCDTCSCAMSGSVLGASPLCGRTILDTRGYDHPHGFGALQPLPRGLPNSIPHDVRESPSLYRACAHRSAYRFRCAR